MSVVILLLIVVVLTYIVLCRDELKSCLAHCEAVIDFGDDDRENDIDDNDMWVLTPRVEQLREQLKHHLDDNRRGEIIRDGVRVALIGPPNAGIDSQAMTLHCY